MAHEAPLGGVLVGFERRQYSAFTDRQTGEQRPGGETLWVYVAPEDGQGAPAAVKISGPAAAESWRELQDIGFGGPVKLRVALFAKNNRIESVLQSIEPVPAGPVQAVG